MHRPWIAPDAASAALVAEVIRRCPSGALHYQAPGMPGEQPDVPTTIRAVEGALSWSAAICRYMQPTAR